MMEIVEKPAVQAGGSQLFLYRIDWRHYFSIAGAAFDYASGTRKVTYGDELFALWNMPWRRFDRRLRLQLQRASGGPAHPRRFSHPPPPHSNDPRETPPDTPFP